MRWLLYRRGKCSDYDKTLHILNRPALGANPPSNTEPQVAPQLSVPRQLPN